MSHVRSKALWIVVVLLALNAFLLAVQPGIAVPRGLAQYFFGPKLVRMEAVVWEQGGPQLYRIDRGRMLRPSRPFNGTLTLVERDGSRVTIPVAANAQVTVNGRPVAVASLRRNMRVITVRKGDAPAELVQAQRP